MRQPWSAVVTGSCVLAVSVLAAAACSRGSYRAPHGGYVQPGYVQHGGYVQQPAYVQPPGYTTPDAPRTQTVADQIAQGRTIFGSRCAECHGSGGEGGEKAPRLVGAGRLPLDPPPEREVRKVQFRTAMDVGQFVLANMPPKGPKLTPDEAWCVLAFALDANGVKLMAPVGPHNASGIVINR